MVQSHFVEEPNSDGSASRFPLKSWIRSNRADIDTSQLTSHQIRAMLKREGWGLQMTPTEVILTPPGTVVASMMVGEGDAEEESEAGSYFSLESQLRDFLATNIASITINGKRLRVYVDEAGRDGVEYPCEVGFIDILAVDAEGAFYVFELKRGKSPDYVLGQIARYMGWIKSTLGKSVPVYGVIVSKQISENLKYARLVANNVYLYEYEVSFSLQPAHDIG
jgi:hypothetical protein